MTFQCRFCNATFKRENTLVVHVCEQKRRHNEQDEKGVKLGLYSYNKFYQYSQNQTKTKTFTEFAKSPYYKAFVKFGRYLLDTKCTNVEQFIIWIIKSGIRLDNWARDSTYVKFLNEYIMKEPVADALTRSIECSVEWGTKHSMNSHDMVRFGNEGILCHYISTGRLSPWALYNSKSGVEFLGRINTEQMQVIFDIIDPAIWDGLFQKKYDDVEFAKAVLKEAKW